MKKNVVIILLLTLIVGNGNCFAQNTWTKLDIGAGATEDLQKAVIFNGKTLIFSANNCYVNDGSDVWEKVKIPKSNYPCPVLFKDYIYLNTTSGIYKSLDGRKWDKTASLSALSLAVNKKKMFAFTGDPFHIAFESQDAIDFQEITGIQNLYPAPNRDAGLYNPRFTFAEAFGDTIYASGFADLGPVEKNCTSFDGGVSWGKEKIGEKITDIELYNGGLFMTVTNHSNIIFIVYGPNSFSVSGGMFFTLKYFKGNRNFYYGGQTQGGGGIIMRGQNIQNSFYTPAPINCLESNEDFIIAVGYTGSVYIMYKPDIISDIPQLSITEDSNIFSNGGETLSVLATPNELITIIDLSGRCVKSFLAVERESIVDISSLDSGCYIIKVGDKSAKFMKK